MSMVFPIAEQRLHSAIAAYFKGVNRTTTPVSVRAALEIVRARIGKAVAFDDEFIIRSIEAYGVAQGYVLRIDGHAA